MTLHPIPSEFPYIWGKFSFFFISVFLTDTKSHSLPNMTHTDKKEKKIFLIYKEIQRDRVQSHIWLSASSFMVKYLHIFSYIRKPFLIYDFASESHLNFLIYEENFLLFFINVFLTAY
jgi:hypothetical protein